MVTGWDDPSGRPAAGDDDDHHKSSRAVTWDLVDLEGRTRFPNALIATLCSVRGENLLPIVEYGPPDAGKFVAHSDPTAAVTRQIELARLAKETYLQLNALVSVSSTFCST